MNREKQPVVSVIVPVYNVEKYLKDCIDSILVQTYTNLEIILVNDGSTDNSYGICEAYAAQDHRVVVIDKENGGVSTARNAGLDAASGDCVVFVDSDDKIAPAMIETLVKECSAENVAVAVGFIRFTDGEKVCETGEYGKKDCSDIRLFTQSRSGMFPWGMIYSRAVIEKLHLRFDTKLGYVEDVVFNTCYLSEMVGLIFLSAKMYYYRQNPTSITSRCYDKRWQVESWFLARQSIFQWFFDGEKWRENARILKFANRYCTNNIVAESAIGKLSYREYAALRLVPPLINWTDIMLLLERLLPCVYFSLYACAMRLRNRIRR